MTKQIYIAIAGLLMTACATTYQPSYLYNEIRVVNNSGETLRSVSVRDTRGGKTFDCGDIGPLGVCSKRFGKRSYQQNPIQIEWAFGSEARRTDEIVIQAPAWLYSGIVTSAVLSVTEQGSLDLA